MPSIDVRRDGKGRRRWRWFATLEDGERTLAWYGPSRTRRGGRRRAQSWIDGTAHKERADAVH